MKRPLNRFRQIVEFMSSIVGLYATSDLMISVLKLPYVEQWYDTHFCLREPTTGVQSALATHDT